MTEKAMVSATIQIKIQGIGVSAAPELVKEWNAYINHVRYEARKMRTCSLTKYQLCCGDCYHCSWHRLGFTVPIDAEWAKKQFEQQMIRDDLESNCIRKLTCQEIYQKAAELYEDGDLILYYYTVEALSIAEIGRRIGAPRETVRYRIKKIMEWMQEHRDEFR